MIVPQLATSSGQDDLCYYNFKCSHPVGVLRSAIIMHECDIRLLVCLIAFPCCSSSFNNVWSNIGYFLLGVTFIIVTFVR